jgi:hypothetical protein
MGETRAEKFGRALSNILRPVVIFYSEKQAINYLDILASDVDNYSFRKRKETEPKHEGCFWSLEALERLNPFDPSEMGLFVRECFDQTYNKDRAYNMFQGFTGAIENLRDDVGEDTI